MTTNANPRAGIYVRISQDRTGEAAGIQRQEADCRALCERLGWAVAAVYSDNDTSAYKMQRKRKGFAALTHALEAGELQAIVAWHPDRLTRRLTELEDLVELLNRTQARVQTVQAGEWDLTTAAGRMTARVIGAAAQYEAETKSERQRRKALELAQAGMPNGGGPRPFGFEADGLTIREDEAEHIRRAALAVLNGRGLAGIGATWPAGSGGGERWSGRNVKMVLTSPRVAGLRQHRGAIYPAQWPPILDRETWESVCAVLNDPARDKRPAKANSYLFGRLIVCGVCGRALEGKPDAKGSRRYGCTKNRGGCGSVARLADPIEELVVHRVLRLCEARGQRPAQAGISEETMANITGLEKRLKRLEDEYVDGRYDDDPDQYHRLRTRLSGALAAARETLQLTPVEFTLGPPVEMSSEDREATGAEAWRSVKSPWVTWWEQADLAQRRALLAEHLVAVRVLPAVRGRNTFDPDAINLVWR